MTKTSKTSASSASAVLTRREKGVTRVTDTNFRWVEREYPQLTAWRTLAIEWLKGETVGINLRLNAMVVFLERYLIQQGLPLDPAKFLARTTALPDFYRTVCPDSHTGIRYNNNVHGFLQFVLLREFSETADNGQPVVSREFHNPVPRKSTMGLPKRDESVHSPLPYGYIDELRQVLAGGPHFRDWRWAQSALGAPIGQHGGRVAPDWFEVTEDQIDPSDPDCVWRERPLANGSRLEMWSPVRWVALLGKLILPLRTFQVRMLDSGEADTWRYEAGSWILNSSGLAQGSERKSRQHGVFRRSDQLRDGEAVTTVLYINTNKTADSAKSGTEKGYVLPWPFGGPVHQDVGYWFEKLRNWQEKYNPVSRLTSWTELDGRHILAKSEVQLAGYPHACFLFRTPEARDGLRHLPLIDNAMDSAWWHLLGALEQRFADRGKSIPTVRRFVSFRRCRLDARRPSFRCTVCVSPSSLH
ncbi:putative phage integrase [compost metagenome]